MSSKKKGINAERELVHTFWSRGWAALRIAGSGSSKYPSADIIASNGSKVFILEVKSTKNRTKYFSRKELEQLKALALYLNAEAHIAVRFKNKTWFFFELEKVLNMKTPKLSQKQGIPIELFLKQQ